MQSEETDSSFASMIHLCAGVINAC